MCLAAVGLRAANGQLEVNFIDVGQADAILVTCPDGHHHLLIDAGDTRYPQSAAHFRSFLTNAFNGQARHLDVAVASHVHADHIGSMLWAMQNFTIDTYIDNGDTSKTSLYGNLRKLRSKQAKGGKLTYVNAKTNPFAQVEFCPSVQMEIFEPWNLQPKLSGPNNHSVAVRLQFDEKTFLFVGDLEQEAEKVLLTACTPEQRQQLKADVLKVGHHCSDTSSTAAFIAAVNPKLAIVSCGKKDVGTNVGYKHPRLSTVRAYGDWFSQNAPALTAPSGVIMAYDPILKHWRSEPRPHGMWFTVKDGNIKVLSDGKSLSVDTQPSPN